MGNPYIKICGLTKEKEAEFINENGVEFVGNVLFFEKSHRCVSIEQAKRIHRELDDAIKKVAVVVSPTIDELSQIADAGFDLVQIHGSLPSFDSLKELGIGVLRAWNGTGMEAETDLFAQPFCAGCLLDAATPGSGKSYDPKLYEAMRSFVRAHDPKADGRLMFLAGGLTPDNVSDVIKRVSPAGVDISSGVELADKSGKDPEAIRRFVRAVREKS
ncbi:MAG: phosphoribosylanthranilate isomerase [Lachnospiraceae bacterium]|nr:phosphoribosylanthranilate isomerase [Lachnospiraceae bacterium]